MVGKGSAGLVYRGILKKGGDIDVAIKCINIYEKEKRKQLLNDLKSLTSISDMDVNFNGEKCPFLVNFYGAFLEEGKQ